MSNHPTHHASSQSSPASRLRKAGLALLPALLLGACATQQAVDEQTQPLRDRVAQTEQSLEKLSLAGKEQSAAAQARDAAMLDRIERLIAELNALRQDLAQSQRASEGLARDQAVAAEAREAVLSGRIEALAERIKSLQDKASGQGERITQAELRLDEMKTVVPERIGQAESRLDMLAGLARATADQAAATEQKRAADAAAGAAIGERLARTEGRVADMAAGARGLAKEVAHEESTVVANQIANQVANQVANEVATPIAAKAAGDMADKLRQEMSGQMAQQLNAKDAERAASILAVADAEKSARGALAERLARTERRLDEMADMYQKAMDMVTYNEIMTNGKVVHTVTLTGDKTLYPLNLPDIHPDDAAKLKGLIDYLATMEKETHRKDYHLEIQGHTDNIGMDDYAYQLAKARAEAVKRYLREKGAISLNHMSVISYGSTVPLNPNSNTNRRIAILVRVLDR